MSKAHELLLHASPTRLRACNENELAWRERPQRVVEGLPRLVAPDAPLCLETERARHRQGPFEYLRSSPPRRPHVGRPSLEEARDRRADDEQGDPDALVFEELRLDNARHGVSVHSTFVELTRTEYQLLELLLLNPRRILPHSLIYDRVWGYDFGQGSNALRVYVRYLRRKLEDAGSRPLIHNVRGVGYVLREP